MSQDPSIQITATSHGKLADGREVRLFTLTNRNGVIARISEFGATLVALELPSTRAEPCDIVLGCETLEDLAANDLYFGATVGRFGNRIAEGRFTLDGKDYTLATNNEPGGLPCHLHGGTEGFDKKLWSGTPVEGGVELTYTSRDGEEGYPGELAVVVKYLLNDENELTWEATAKTSAATPINLVHHPYWNLSGDGASSIDNHLVTLNSAKYLATGIGMIPTGVAVDVNATPMDFRAATSVGQRINHDYQSLTYAEGYDHAYIIDGTGLRLAATVTDPGTGRRLEVSSNQPALHFYSGNFIPEDYPGKRGQKYGPRTGLCLESENYPNSPNEETFPDSILRPGESYLHKVIYRFSW